jgi:hypothetical protein
MGHQRVLVASHGTDGARAAETLALASCAPGATLHHLYVVPDLWRGMMGDDWLNNVRTRIRFGDYLEGELASEAGWPPPAPRPAWCMSPCSARVSLPHACSTR